MQTKQYIFLGRGARAKNRRLRAPRRTALPRGSKSWVLWQSDYFLGCLCPVVLTQGPSWWCTHCSAKMEANERDSGRWSDTGRLLLTFLELFQWVVAYSVFLTRTSCHKTAHANAYCGAWPGWAVSVSVLPLTHKRRNSRELSLHPPFPSPTGTHRARAT